MSPSRGLATLNGPPSPPRVPLTSSRLGWSARNSESSADLDGRLRDFTIKSSHRLERRGGERESADLDGKSRVFPMQPRFAALTASASSAAAGRVLVHPEYLRYHGSSVGSCIERRIGVLVGVGA